MKHKTDHRIIDHVFKNLMPAQGLAERPEQITLSHRMLSTMLGGGIALCDAGTGIGKTYAYLVAGTVYQRYRAGKHLPFQPILISTSSIALQNAVLNEYIPFLSMLLISDGIISAPIRAVIRKGKQHYVCDERLERRLRQVDLKKKNKAVANALASLLVNLDIDQAERLSGYDRERVCVPQCCDCRRSTCRYLAFLQECATRQYAFQICNHNLLLADAMRREANHRPILPDSCAVVIDEAHKLPEAARQMFGETLDAEAIRELARDLKREKFYLAADSLADLSKPLLQMLEAPREDKPFSEYARMLIAPNRVLGVIGKQLYDQLVPMARRQLKDISRAASMLCDERDDLIRYASCPVRQIPEAELHAAFLRMYHKLKWRGDEFLARMIKDLRSIRKRKMLWSEDIVALNKRISELSEQNQLLSSMNQMGLVDPDIYIARSNEYGQQLREAKRKRSRLLDEDGGDDTIEKTTDLLDALESMPDFLPEYDEAVFCELVERMELTADDRLVFHLSNGLALTEGVERRIRP